MKLLANTTSPFVRITRMSLIEKGFDIEPTIVDPWADDPRLRAANAATRVPALVLDDGTPLTESLLIVQWLEVVRPAPDWPRLIGNTPQETAGILSRAGIALGAIDASVHTISRARSPRRCCLTKRRSVCAGAARWSKAWNDSRRWPRR